MLCSGDSLVLVNSSELRYRRRMSKITGRLRLLSKVFQAGSISEHDPEESEKRRKSSNGRSWAGTEIASFYRFVSKKTHIMF